MQNVVFLCAKTDGFFTAMKDGGYNGYYALEFETPKGDETVQHALDFFTK